MSTVPQLVRRLRALLGPLWWYAALLFCVNRLGDVVNLYTGAFLIPRFVPEEDLGAVRPLLLLAGFVATPVGLLVTPAEKYFNVFAERNEPGRARLLFRRCVAATLLFLALVGALVALRPGFFMRRWGIGDSRLLVAAVLLGAATTLRPLFLAAARAFKRFSAVVWAGVPAPFVRLVVILLVARAWPLQGYLAAQIASELPALLVLGLSIFLFFRARRAVPESFGGFRGEMFRYAVPLLFFNLLTNAQGFVEAWVIRQRLPPEVSAADYLVEMLAVLPFYFGDAITAFLFPVLSSKHEHGEDTSRTLVQSMVVSAFLGLGSTCLLFVVAPPVFAARADWAVALPFAALVPLVALGKTFRMVTNCFLLHEQACRRFRFLAYYLPVFALLSAGLYAYAGMEFFLPRLPASLASRLAALPPLSLPLVLSWTAAGHAVTLLCVFVHLSLRRKKAAR